MFLWPLAETGIHSSIIGQDDIGKNGGKEISAAKAREGQKSIRRQRKRGRRARKISQIHIGF